MILIYKRCGQKVFVSLRSAVMMMGSSSRCFAAYSFFDFGVSSLIANYKKYFLFEVEVFWEATTSWRNLLLTFDITYLVKVCFVTDRSYYIKWWAHQIVSETMKLKICKAEFVYLFLYTMNNNIHLYIKISEHMWWANQTIEKLKQITYFDDWFDPLLGQPTKWSSKAHLTFSPIFAS